MQCPLILDDSDSDGLEIEAAPPSSDFASKNVSSTATPSASAGLTPNAERPGIQLPQSMSRCSLDTTGESDQQSLAHAAPNPPAPSSVAQAPSLLSPNTQRGGAAEGMQRQASTPLLPGQVHLVIPENMRRLTKANVKLQRKQALGKGGFAEVVLGEAPAALCGSSTADPTATRKVAVKIMDKSQVSRSTFVNLQAEIDICANLSHPCLINTHGIFEDESCIYIVMDLCEGGEMFKYMKRFGLEDMPLVAPNFIGEVILGLEFMLSKGYIHRDIKPENLLLTDDYHVKIADFGTCCLVDSPGQKFTGTALYVAPECIANGAGSRTSDIWSLGCVLYQLFVGRPPFQGESHYMVIQNIRQRKFDFPPYFPPAARDLVDRMLDPNPLTRIGAGGFEEIKRHPFFDKVDWDSILMQSNITHLNANYNKMWESFLLDGERVVYSSRIVKERYLALSVKERILILTDYPRLFYLEPGSLTIKGQVPWSDDIAAEAASQREFHVHTGGSRTYHFVDSENRANLWAAKINDQVKVAKSKAKAASSPKRGH